MSAQRNILATLNIQFLFTNILAALRCIILTTCPKINEDVKPILLYA